MDSRKAAVALYPMFARLQDRAVLVVGGGAVAERKVQLLLAADARIHVRALRCNARLRALAEAGRIATSSGPFEPGLLAGVWLAVAATDDAAVNHAVARAADAAGVLVNVVDDPAHCSVQTPAIIDRAPLLVAISSAGAAPMVARAVREQVEALLDDGLGPLVQLAQAHRARIQARRPDLAARRRFYQWLQQGPVLELARSGQLEQAEAALLAALDEPAAAAKGLILLVGTAGEDSGQLTLAGLRALNRADTLIVEQGVPRCFVELARRDAERIDGPAAAASGLPPAAVRQQALALARAGQTVVVLCATHAPVAWPDPRAGVALRMLPTAPVPDASTECATHQIKEVA